MRVVLAIISAGVALGACDTSHEPRTYLKGTLNGAHWEVKGASAVNRDTVITVGGSRETPDKVCSRADPCAVLTLDVWVSSEKLRPYPLRRVILVTYREDVIDPSAYSAVPAEWPVRDERMQGTVRCFTTGGPLYRDLRYPKRHTLPDTLVFKDLRVCYEAP